jgi:hypothetical protein
MPKTGTLTVVLGECRGDQIILCSVLKEKTTRQGFLSSLRSSEMFLALSAKKWNSSAVAYRQPRLNLRFEVERQLD